MSLTRLAELPVVKTADTSAVLRAAADKAEAGIPGAMGTVLSKRGSAPGTPGQKLYVASDGTAIGTVGGGAVEREVLLALLEMIEHVDEAEHEVRSFKLGPELGMCCGGGVEVLLEPIARLIPCVIVGGGHVATAVAPMLARVGFSVTVADAREGWGADGRIPGVRCIQDDYDAAAANVSRSGAFIVMTHDHALDQEAIEWALRQGFAYVGGVGSRAKAKRTRDRLLAKGFSAEDVGRVKMPIGLAVGARLPDEIAVAIAAEMVAWKRGARST